MLSVAAEGGDEGGKRRCPVLQKTLLPVVDAVIFLLLLAQLVSFLPFEGVDDAFISFRYARNFASGNGLVYNPGERVEGFSNPLWTVGIGLLRMLGVPLMTGWWVMALLCVAGMFLFLRAACLAQFGRRRWLARLPLLLAVCMSPALKSFGNGLEGAAVALAVSCILAGAVLRAYGLAAAGAVMMVLNRPEGMLIAAPACLWMLREFWRNREKRRRIALCIVSVAASVAVLTAWRYWYYHDFVPNTLRAKASGMGLAALWPASSRYLADYARAVGIPVICAAACAVFARSRRDLFLLAAGMAGLNAFTVYMNQGDWMPHYRLLSPYHPLIAFLAVLALQGPWDRRPLLARPAGVALCALACIHTAGLDGVTARLEALRWYVPAGWSDEIACPLDLPQGVTAPDFSEPDDVFVVENGGRAGYWLDGVRVVEMFGLTDRDLTTQNTPFLRHLSQMGVVNWVGLFEKQPTYWQFTANSMLSNLREMARIPALMPELGRFMAARQKAAPPWGGVLWIRGDRGLAARFLAEGGDMAPLVDYLAGPADGVPAAAATGQANDPAGDILRTPWGATPWRAEDGTEYKDTWQPWNAIAKLCSSLPARGGRTVFTRRLVPDGAPLIVAVGACSENGPACRAVLSLRANGGPDIPVGAVELAAGGGGTFKTHFLTIPAPPKSDGNLLLEVEAKAEGPLLVACTRWCSGPLPELPAVSDRPAVCRPGR